MRPALTACLLVLAAGPAAAWPLPSDFPTPYPDDPRCGRFGWDPRGRMPRIPVASPRVLDASLRGEVVEAADTLARTLAADLELSGVFAVNDPTAAPEGAPLWDSDLSFDYLGWRDAGAWMVPTAVVAPAGGGNVRARIDCRLTEEADTLRLGAAEAVVAPGRVATFAHRYVNALLRCITGVPGAFGTRIAYARRPGPGQPKEVYVVEFGSSEETRVSRDGELAMLPSWGPGGAIAWTGYASGDPDIYIAPRGVCRPASGAPDAPGILSARKGLETGVAWAPDGTFAALTLVTDGNPDIWLIDGRTGEEVARLTDSSAIDTSPAWSPDGSRIAFVSDRLGFPQVFVMQSDGREQRPLPLPGTYNTSPDWSPDGAEIAYQARGEGSPFSIWTYDVETGALRRLTAGPWEDEEPSWSPDGRLIAFTSNRRGKHKRLYVMSRDGSGVRPLLPKAEGDYFTPAWERTFVP